MSLPPSPPSHPTHQGRRHPESQAGDSEAHLTTIGVFHHEAQAVVGLESIFQRLREGRQWGTADSASTLPALAQLWELGSWGSNLSSAFWGM